MRKKVCCWALGMALAVMPGVGMAQDLGQAARVNMGSALVITGTIAETGVDSQSSGCCIDTRGYVLATSHQVLGVTNIEGRLRDGTVVSLTPVEVLPDWELALLKSDRALPEAVNIGNAAELYPGSSLFSIATPEELDFSLAAGIVSNLDRTLKGHWAIQADFRVSPGSSGGPVFDAAGRLVGLVFGRTDFGEGWTVVLPINNAYPLLRRNGIAVPETPLGDEMDAPIVPVAGVTEMELRAIDAYNRGVAAHDPQTKIAAYDVAVKLLKEFYEAHFNYAVALTALGDLDAAVAAYDRAAQLRPEEVAPRRNLGRLYLARKESDKAVAVFESAQRLAPEHPQSYNDLGEALRQAGRQAEAAEQYQKALELNGDYPAAHFNLGLTLVNLDRPEEAVAHFETYLRLAPDAADAAQVRQWIDEIKNQR